ncbi:VOC family protein [Streptomyces sp. NPDC054756]
MTPPGKLPAPQHGLLLTHFITVRDVAVSRRFYTDVFGGEVVRAEDPAMVKVANGWIIMNPGGGPTADKPGVTLEAPRTGDRVSGFLNVRVADLAAFYAHAVAQGADFLTEPVDRGAELRCYLRDPDGHLIEVGQSTGLLLGVQAEAPRDATGGGGPS